MVHHAFGSKDPVPDDPPYSRLFVVYNRKDPLNDEELREEFGQYGEIQDIFVVKDKSTGDPKGVAYVKFSKMSEAALAMEKLNHQPVKNKSGVYKVFIAKNKGESKGSDEDDPNRYSRLFVMVPKTASENDVREHFSKFGEVQTVKLLRNKKTNESKGIGYVTYSRIYEAALAVEKGENDQGYKAVIARPKEKNPPAAASAPSQETHTSISSNFSRKTSKDIQATSESFTAFVSTKLTTDQIFRLFDIAPGLRNIKTVSQNAYRFEIIATYNSMLAAEYALNKLHGVEYPIGDFISIDSKMPNKRNDFSSGSLSSSVSGPLSGSLSNFLSNSINSGKRDYRGEQIDYRMDSPSQVSADSNQEVNQKLSALSKALTDATALLKSAGLSQEHLNANSENSESGWSSSKYCDFPVPRSQPILSKTAFNEHTGMRLFFVGHPSAPSLEALYDVYCRFGNFSGASVMARKNYGYLYFTSPESALKAKTITDEKIIAGMTLKLLPADPKKGEPSSKRKRVEQ